MGSIGQTLMGGSKQNTNAQSTSSSYNQAYPFLQNAFGGLTNNASQGTDAISALLGIGGNPQAQSDAFDRFRNSTGYNFQMDQGTQAITGNAASRGLLNSGATLKGLSKFGQGLASSSMNDYMNQLMGLANTGFKAGDLISGAGNVSNSQSTSKTTGSNKPGLGGFLGKIAGGIATGGATLAV